LTTPCLAQWPTWADRASGPKPAKLDSEREPQLTRARYNALLHSSPYKGVQGCLSALMTQGISRAHRDVVT